MVMKNKIKILIDPSCKIEYSSYYIKGLYDEFGKGNVSFSSRYFKELKRKEESHSHDHYMAFVVVRPDKSLTKIIIDFRDKPSVKERAYKWSDKYAKINFNAQLTDKIFHDKMMLIPPAFGVKIWNFLETGYYCFSNLIRCNFHPVVPMRDYVRDYKNQYERPYLDYFLNASSESVKSIPYVFFNSRLWPHQNCLKGTNLQRKNFIEICRTACNFEGGFFASKDHIQYEEFKDLITFKEVTKSYFEKTKISRFVFNTPAVHECHGWKLGEFLAMGKAIISTPLNNEIPGELVHGRHIHFITNEKELKVAINLLINDDAYRNLLEAGAKNYYLRYANPRSVIVNILQDKPGYRETKGKYKPVNEFSKDQT
jgi:hypothetical protein